MSWRTFFALSFLVFVFFSVHLSAEDFIFPDGNKYEDVQVLKRTPGGIEFKHKKGISFKKYSELPDSLRSKYNKDSYEAYVKEKKEKRKASKEEFLSRKITKLKKDIAETEKKIADLESKVSVCKSKSETIKTNIETQEKVLKVADSELKKEYKDNVQGCYWHMYWVSSDKMSRKEALMKRWKEKRKFHDLSSRYDICSIRLKKYTQELSRERFKLLRLKEQLRKGGS
jgi:uncharacterized protein YeeX (DUF496 family)